MARGHHGSDLWLYVVASCVVAGWMVGYRAAWSAEPLSISDPTKHSETYKNCDELEGKQDWTGLLRWLRQLPSTRHGDYYHAFYLAKAYYGLRSCQLGDVERDLCIAWVQSDYPYDHEKLQQMREPLERMRKAYCSSTDGEYRKPLNQKMFTFISTLSEKDAATLDLLFDIPILNSRVEKLEEQSGGK